MSGIFAKYTWKTLKENRSRTLVTIVGIILSVALLTAVTVSISSAMAYMEDVAVARTGDWSVNVFAATEEEMESMIADNRVRGYTAVQNVGYALIGSTNEDKPYLYVGGMDEYLTERMPFVLTEGRLPENETELLIPMHLRDNGEVVLELGQTLMLELGQRISDGKRLDQHGGFMNEGSYAYPERFVPDGRVVTYTVVGFYERPVFEERIAAGYTALTVLPEGMFDSGSQSGSAEETETMVEGGTGRSDGADATVLAEPTWELWLRLGDAGTAASQTFVRDYMTDAAQAVDWEENGTLQRYTGASDSDVMVVLYLLESILMIMVVAGSVALIYNAFSISVTERIRQFGLLKSLGATKQQIMGSVLWEGLILCAAAIPFGILVGCAGISATIWACRDLFATVLLSFTEEAEFTVHISAWSMVSTIALSIVTVLISAWIPARKALRIPAIDAIRQSQEIRLHTGKGWLRLQRKQLRTDRLRTGWLTRRLFGLEGMLASKNFKRNRRRYRSTIVSLSFSVILFICANSFCHYLTRTVESGVGSEQYDIGYYMQHTVSRDEAQETYEEMKAIEEMDDSALRLNVASMAMSIDPEDMSREYRKYWEENDGREWEYCSVFLVEEESYRAFLEGNHLDPDIYLDGENPTALVYDRMRIYDDATSSADVYFGLKDDTQELELLITEGPEGYRGNIMETDQGSQVLMYRVDENGNMLVDLPPEEREYYVSLEEGVRRQKIQIGQILEEAPWFAGNSDWLSVFLPESAAETLGIQKRLNTSYLAVFMARDHEQAYAKMQDIFGLRGNGIIQYYAESAAEIRALLTLIEVFSGGFLALISLITAANVFNTISTNILLRRREFAMLNSIGMSEKGLQRILGYECLLYGCKSLLYALPISIFLTWLIYDMIKNEGYFTGFYIPWTILVIAVGAVFLIVSATMVYSRWKLQTGSLTDVLRNENA